MTPPPMTTARACSFIQVLPTSCFLLGFKPPPAAGGPHPERAVRIREDLVAWRPPQSPRPNGDHCAEWWPGSLSQHRIWVKRIVLEPSASGGNYEPRQC